VVRSVKRRIDVLLKIGVRNVEGGRVVLWSLMRDLWFDLCVI
jgi:hypothetical protein